jgi:hypothetical protein
LETNKFSTLADALKSLQERGFTDTFVAREDGLHAEHWGRMITPAEVTIVEYHRFEGETNPDDMSVVYGIECSDGLKGTIIDAYGAYANPLLSDFLRKVPIKNGP